MKRPQADLGFARARFDVRVVPADDGDVRELTELLQAEYAARYRSVIVDTSRARGAGSSSVPDLVLLGYVNNRAVAMGAWRRGGPAGETDGEIRNMFVVSTFRGEGYARQVLAQLESSAASRGIRRLVLETSMWLPEALALYRAAGYVDIDPFGPFVDAAGVVHLAKVL